jgi:CheY-like chemotaxis protein
MKLGMASNSQDDSPSIIKFLEASVQQVATALGALSNPSQAAGLQVMGQLLRIQQQADQLLQQDLAHWAGQAAESARSWGAAPGGDPRAFFQRLHLLGTKLLDQMVRSALRANATSKKVSHRMLVVDDSPVSADALASAFASAGFSVRTAETLKEVEELIKSFEPNILVSDVRMPNLDVTDLCARFRLTLGPERCVVVLVSAGTESDVRNRLDSIKPDAFVSKVAGAANVLSKVQQVCFEKLG